MLTSKQIEQNEKLTEEYGTGRRNEDQPLVTEPKSKDSGTLRYHCRMCGEQYANGLHVPNIWTAMMVILEGWENPWQGGIPMSKITESHHHKDGTIGIADLIGAIPDEKR